MNSNTTLAIIGPHSLLRRPFEDSLIAERWPGISSLIRSQSPSDASSRPVMGLGDVRGRFLSLIEAESVVATPSLSDRVHPTDLLSQAFEWCHGRSVLDVTDPDPVPAFGRIDDEAAEFIRNSNIVDSAKWLLMTASEFFGGADFEIGVLRGEDEEGDVLSLKVHAGFGASEFGSCRHRICQAMIAAGHKRLYETISIFQRRVLESGRHSFSWYCYLSSE